MLLQLLISGVSMGMIYGLMAMGLILIVKAVGVLNFAHGDLFMFGAYLAYMLTYQFNFPLWLMLPSALILFGIVGIIFMFSVYWPLRNAAWPVTITISTLGRLMQATAQDRYAAELMGIPTIIAIMATYMISITIASIGGWLAAPLFLVSQSLGSMSLKAFAGIVVGGFGNVKGAVVGSLLIGIIEAYSTLLTSVYKDAIVFLFLILVLLIRPQGIFGERIADKA